MSEQTENSPGLPVVQTENNEKGCLAHQIILELFEAGATSQIQLLSMATALSHKQLDPDGYRKFIEHSLSISCPPVVQTDEEIATEVANEFYPISSDEWDTIYQVALSAIRKSKAIPASSADTERLDALDANVEFVIEAMKKWDDSMHMTFREAIDAAMGKSKALPVVEEGEKL